MDNVGQAQRVKNIAPSVEGNSTQFTEEEIKAMVETARDCGFSILAEAGMRAMKAVKCATINAATLPGAESTSGNMQKDKPACIIAVDGDATTDVAAMDRGVFVMKDGTIYKSTIGG